MIPYILIFFISLLLMVLSEKVFKKSKVLKTIFALLSIISISYFASIRADEIGTDVLVYVKPFLEYTKIYGIGWLFKYSECEVLYLLLNHFVAIANGGIQHLLFVISFFISFMFYKYAKNFESETDVCITYAVYLFVFFGITLNLVRQSIATAIVIYSMKYLKKEDFKGYIISVIIASGFHISAIIMIPIFFLYKFFGTKKELLVKIIVTVISIITVLCAEYLLKYMYLFSNKFDTEYVNRYMNNSWHFNLTWEILKLFIFIILMIVLRYKNNTQANKYDKKYFDFCKFLLILDLVFFQFGAIFRYAERFSYYFMIISYSYLIPCLLDIFKKKEEKELRILPTIMIMAILLIYFYTVFALLKISSIIPYSTR